MVNTNQAAKPLAVWLDEVSREDQFSLLRNTVENRGFSYFHQFLEDIKTKIKEYGDEDEHAIRAFMDKAMLVFPNPGAYSPAWEQIWSKLSQMITCKSHVLHNIPVSERQGEWQVILDNPFRNEGVACYPNLSFGDGVYLYSYFRTDLTKNEYVRLQKVVTTVTNQGGHHSDEVVTQPVVY